MRTTTGPLLAVALTLALAASAGAGAGDYLLVQGTIAVWPQEPFAYGVALVQGDDGARYFVQFTPVTSSPAGLRPGDPVNIVGREGYPPDQISAITVERRMPGTATGWQTLTGNVESRSGSTLILRLADGRRIAVDMSQMPAEQSGTLLTGQDVTVVGLLQTPTLLTARGLATSSTEAPAALPRQ
jgi:hypothetical protein